MNESGGFVFVTRYTPDSSCTAQSRSGSEKPGQIAFVVAGAFRIAATLRSAIDGAAPDRMPVSARVVVAPARMPTNRIPTRYSDMSPVTHLVPVMLLVARRSE